MKRLRLLCVPQLLIRLLILASLSAVSVHAAFAQATRIQPCEAGAAPAKAVTPKCSEDSSKTATRAGETLIDSTITPDPELEKLISPYAGKVRELSIVIGTLEGELTKDTVGASTMGNFITDAIKSVAARRENPVVLAVTNSGGMRKSSIVAGQLRVSDIFELLPFENGLMTIDLTGSQLLKLLQNLTNARDAQAGARIQYRWNADDRPEFISARLVDSNGREKEIDADATYTIVTLDYLYKLGSGNYAILQDGRNPTPLNLTIRDAVIQYVKSETSAGRSIRPKLDDRFVQVGPRPEKPGKSPND